MIIPKEVRAGSESLSTCYTRQDFGPEYTLSPSLYPQLSPLKRQRERERDQTSHQVSIPPNTISNKVKQSKSKAELQLSPQQGDHHSQPPCPFKGSPRSSPFSSTQLPANNTYSSNHLPNPSAQPTAIHARQKTRPPLLYKPK